MSTFTAITDIQNTGDWRDPLNWDLLESYPGAGDIVVTGNHIITISADTPAAQYKTTGTGYFVLATPAASSYKLFSDDTRAAIAAMAESTLGDTGRALTVTLVADGYGGSTESSDEGEAYSCRLMQVKKNEADLERLNGSVYATNDRYRMFCGPAFIAGLNDKVKIDNITYEIIGIRSEGEIISAIKVYELVKI
jgi:hypothetical protein